MQRLATDDNELVRQEDLPFGDQIADLVHRLLISGEEDIHRRACANLESEDVGASECKGHVLVREALVIRTDLAQRILKTRRRSHLQLLTAGTADEQQGEEGLPHGLIQ